MDKANSDVRKHFLQDFVGRQEINKEKYIKCKYIYIFDEIIICFGSVK